MAQKRINAAGRVFFDKEESLLKTPDLIAHQKESWRDFIDSGLSEIFNELNPIDDYTGQKLSLRFKKYNFQGEKNYLEGLDDIEALTEMNLPRPMKIEYLYLKRGRDYHFTGLKLIGYDKNGNRVLELKQLNKIKRGYVGFNNTGEKVEVSKLEFQTENGNKSYVIPEIFIGESLE